MLPTSPVQRFTLRVEGKKALLYDRAGHRYHRVRKREAFVLVASQDVGLPDAVRLLARHEDPEVAVDVGEALLDRGWIGADGRFAGRVVELAPVEGAWGSPLVVHLGVTLACNFACSHCYSSSGRRAPDELTLPEIEALIDQMAAMGCQKLVLGGGEPFVRKDLPAIVRHADERGVDTFVHTNGSLVERSDLEALAAHPPAGLSISLDGPDAETNDRVRGDGAFERAVAGARVLRDAYPPGFNVSFTVTPTNAHATPRMVELADDLGAGVLLLRPAYPAGEALTSDDVVCDRDTFARAVELAEPRARERGLVVDAPHPEREVQPDFDGFGCVAGRVVLGVDPRGRVTPCLNLPESFFTGSLRTSPLAELWRADAAHAEVRAQVENEQCASCKHYRTCRGGCRVRALADGAGLGGPDSWCHYEPKDGREPVRYEPPSSRSRSLPVVG